MFGNLNKPAFGASTSTGFGFGTSTANNANPFNQNQSNMFGRPATTGFGMTNSSFGQPQTNSLFSNQQQPSMFPNTNTSFGTTPSTQSGFGTGTLFGQQQTQQQPLGGGLFNSGTSTFGQPAQNAGFSFGQTQNQGAAGAAGGAATGGLFGQQAQAATAQNPFQTQPANTFGAAATAGGFGAQQQQQQQQLGTPIKFQHITGSDTMVKNGSNQSISTKHHSITCMKEYENKSFEELRYEDYQMNRKGPQTGVTGFGGTQFGAPVSSANSFFGATDQNKSAFGQSTSMFGQMPTSSTFGQTPAANAAQNPLGTANSMFAKPTGFGSPAANTTLGGSNFASMSVFGGNNQNTTSVFGQNQQNKPFGAAPVFGTPATSQPTQGFGTPNQPSLFSQNTSTANIFGKPTQPTTTFGTLGQTNQTTFGLGQPAVASSTPSLFTANKPMFGQANTSTTGFGATTNTFGTAQNNTFSNMAKPAFGNTLNSNNLGFGGSNMFGQPQQPTTGIFGAPAKPEGTGFFGASTSTTGLFGNTNTGFGTTNTAFGAPLNSTPGTDSAFGQNAAAPNLALMTSSAFGDSPHFEGLEPKTKVSVSHHTTNPSELMNLLSTNKVGLTQGTKLNLTPRKPKESLFEDLRANGRPTDLVDIRRPSQTRQLIIKPGSVQDPHVQRDELLTMITSPNRASPAGDKQAVQSPPQVTNGLATETPLVKDSMSKTVLEKKPSLKLNFDSSLPEDSGTGAANQQQSPNNSSSAARDASATEPQPAASAPAHPTGIVCTRPEYFTMPPLDELATYVESDGVCLVRGFTIGRHGYGNVHFSDEMDVSGIDIDHLVHFRHREINIYPDERIKPPVGQGLNRPAQVTLDNIFPKRSGSNEHVTDAEELLQMNFAERLRKVTVNKGARFVEYRPESGSWVFKVQHFSKYGFNDSDDEEGVEGGEVVARESKEVVKQSATEMDLPLPDPSRTMFETKKYGLDEDIIIEEEDEPDLIPMMEPNDDFHDIAEDPYEFDLPIADNRHRMSRQIQMMKSTLFAIDDDQASEASSHVSIMRQYLDLPEDIAMEEQHFKVLDTLVEEEDDFQAAEMQQQQRPVFRPHVVKTINFGGIELDHAISSRSCMDMAVFKGRSFKVGWSKGYRFVNKTSAGENNRVLNVSTLNFGGSLSVLNECLIDSLKIVLQQSSHTTSASNVPTFQIIRNPIYLRMQEELFDKLYTKSNTPEAQYLYSIWSLCAALWGPGEETTDNRHYLLSKWLKNNTTASKDKKECTPTAIYELLTVFDVAEAARVAIENQHPVLGLLIAQLSMSTKTKTLLHDQIQSWYASLAADQITPEIKKIYFLLSAIPVKDGLNVFEDVDWVRAFAMHLWYMAPSNAPIQTAFSIYNKAHAELEYARKPSPRYCAAKTNNDNQYQDVIYQILTLYTAQTHGLATALSPLTHTHDPLDYRLTWLLMQLFQSLDVGLLGEPENAKFCTSFSLQLENMDKWEWAVFVLLFLKDDVVKRKLIVDILNRNLSPETDKISLDVQNNLVNNMKVPAEWIHLVKGQKLLCLERYFEAFNHLCKAGDFVQANDILIDQLVPGLFINEQYDIVKMLVEQMQPAVAVSAILKWDNEVGLVADFVDLHADVWGTAHENLYKLQMQLANVSQRLVYFPMKTDQQRLCVSEMSKRCSSLYKELIRLRKEPTTDDAYVNFVDSLVMPADYKHDEGMYIINRILS